MRDHRPYHSYYVGRGVWRTEPWTPLASRWFWRVLFLIVLAGAAVVLWGRSDALHRAVAVLILVVLLHLLRHRPARHRQRHSHRRGHRHRL